MNYDEPVLGTQGHMTMPSLPSFHLKESQLPAMKNWQVGKKYSLVIDVEMVSMGKDEYMEGKPMGAQFRIKSVKEKT